MGGGEKKRPFSAAEGDDWSASVLACIVTLHRHLEQRPGRLRSSHAHHRSLHGSYQPPPVVFIFGEDIRAYDGQGLAGFDHFRPGHK